MPDRLAGPVFEAVISREVAETSHGRDALALIGADLATGISPGFWILPKRAVPKAEEIEQEPVDEAVGGSARAAAGIIEALSRAKEASLPPELVAAAFGAVDWKQVINPPAG